jgi:hypothetical protein
MPSPRPIWSGVCRRWKSISPGSGFSADVARLINELEPGDRVEIYRPLKADPKEVRRQLAELERQRAR